jgi:hypothetical protein
MIRFQSLKQYPKIVGSFVVYKITFTSQIKINYILHVLLSTLQQKYSFVLEFFKAWQVPF